ncbi:MAG TPA: hypothetical protein VFE19_00135 [Jatrophihabitantaceae bacterium]|jgi:hypothetical protein|nr:hypothetical protein [Jatrophihabitantaceae bacterium]
MGRHNRRRVEAEPVLRSTANERREHWRGVEYAVRTVSGANAVKPYRCPGCDQEIQPGVAHVVTWPADDLGAGNRRHWHTPCWAAREHRAPTRRG